jgi:hypothetical protein
MTGAVAADPNQRITTGRVVLASMSGLRTAMYSSLARCLSGR